MIPFTRILAVFTLAFAALSAWANPTKPEAIAQVNAFIAHAKKVGIDQAIKDCNTAPEWKAGGMNLIVNEFGGKVVASSLNEKLVGKNTLESKDPNGKEFVKDFVSTARNGEGWIDYMFINPTSRKLEERSMFVKRLPGYDGFVGVAITKN